MLSNLDSFIIFLDVHAYLIIGDIMDEIKNRVIEMANVFLEGKRTVREVAKIVGYSKSTVHHDLTTKLEDIDPFLYLKVKELLEYNKKIRHIRGGESTRLKYLMESQ